MQPRDSLTSAPTSSVQLMGKHAWNRPLGMSLRLANGLLDRGLLGALAVGVLQGLTHPWKGPLPWLSTPEEIIGLSMLLGAAAGFSGRWIGPRIGLPLLPSWWLWDIRVDAIGAPPVRRSYQTPLMTTLRAALGLGLFVGAMGVLMGIGHERNLSRKITSGWTTPARAVSEAPPEEIREDEWITLPVFTLLAHWPLQESGGDPFLLTLPFSEKIPAHYLPYARLQHPRSRTEIEIRGPKVLTGSLHEQALGELSEKIRATVKDDAFGELLTTDSYPFALSPLSTAGTKSVAIRYLGTQDSGLALWFSHPEQFTSVHLRSPSGDAELRITQQWRRRASDWVLQKDIGAARSFLNSELAQVRLPKKAFITDGKSPRVISDTEYSALFRTELLVGAKLTLDPGSVESWYHFGGLNFWIREAALMRESPDLARLAERNFQVALQSLQLLAPQHALTQELAALKVQLLERLQK